MALGQHAVNRDRFAHALAELLAEPRFAAKPPAASKTIGEPPV